MIVKLTREEVIQACQEWAHKHHRLVLSGTVKIFAVIPPQDYVQQAKDVAIEFPDAKGGGGPYREPG